MRNLEQIRAANALSFANKGAVSGDKGGELIKKIAPLIQNHGLLATASFSFGEKEGWQRVFDAIAQHLADKDIGIVGSDVKDRLSLMTFLTQPSTTSETLKLATTETMAWLTFARRFVKKV